MPMAQVLDLARGGLERVFTAGEKFIRPRYYRIGK